MAETWHIARSSRTCAHSGAPIDTTRPFYSALVENDDGFGRLDFTIEAWPDAAKNDFFSYWKNKGNTPGAADKKGRLDYDRLLSFFDSLENHSEPRHLLFRYVLALVLARRRILRLDDMGRTEAGDRLVVYDKRGGKTIEIVAPEAGREELEKVQERLNQLFETDGDEVGAAE